ncbi:hypothetical protein E2C01_005599 [Portunus trituberculatus]|uniref:Uncharacterized protein n=1 Tax=Portunus trituberculatus TaxID=210409 RepID=A0A5B7CVX8_PORTR|nr:hypothetical protein [Portunus trituberculatus]
MNGALNPEHKFDKILNGAHEVTFSSAQVQARVYLFSFKDDIHVPVDVDTSTAFAFLYEIHLLFSKLAPVCLPGSTACHLFSFDVNTGPLVLVSGENKIHLKICVIQETARLNPPPSQFKLAEIPEALLGLQVTSPPSLTPVPPGT